MVKERAKKNEEDKSSMKPISIFKEDVEIIQKELSKYGDFSQYVRFCLRDSKQIEKFRKAKTAY